MKGEKRYWGVFLRTLAAFLAVWLLMAGLLTEKNAAARKNGIYVTIEADRRWVAQDVLLTQQGGASPERKPYIMQYHLSDSYFDGVLGVYRVYDDRMNEWARTPMAWGCLVVDYWSNAYDHYILFDEVLSDQEQIELAERIKAADYNVVNFHGSAYKVEDDSVLYEFGLYGEITGIYDEAAQTVLPQKLVYYFEDGPVTLMESDHEMFDGAELTTLRFEAAKVGSALAWGDPSPKELLGLYRQAEAELDDLVAHRTATNWSTTERLENGRLIFNTASSDVPIASAHVYTNWRVATNEMGFTYISTLLVAILAAVWISHVQIRTLKRERRFTRAVAHDIKTPAAVLRAYAEALHEGTTPERQREYLESMMEESDQMAVLVNELLALSRMEGSAALLLEEDVNLTELVRYHFERLTNPLNDRGLRVQLDLYPVSVKGDTARLTQVVSNLAANLLRHAKPGPAAVTLKREGKRAVLTVANCCDPIPEEKLKHLWDPFYKVDESRSAGGSGLGLAVVKNVVELHGGTCSLRTIPDGIEFRIELPVSAG